MFGIKSTGYSSAPTSRPVQAACIALFLAGFAVPGLGQGKLPDHGVVFRPVPLALTGEATFSQDPVQDANLKPAKKLKLVSHQLDYDAVHGAIEDYRQAIALIEEEQGLYAPELFQNLVGVAMQYEKLGEYALALAEYERAEYIDRINNGLYTQEQIATAESAIRILEKLNRFDKAGERLDNYVYMHEKLYGQDSVRIVEALDKLADWQFQAFRISMSQYPGEAAGMVNYFNGLVMDNSPQGILQKTQNTWLRAIRLLVENHAYSNPMLPELEDKLLESYFLHANLSRMLYGTGGNSGLTGNSYTAIEGNASGEIEYRNFANGVNVFRRKLHYLKQVETFQGTDYADTLVELADWYMLFGQRSDALATYQEAWDLMQENAISAAYQEQLLQPPVPVSLTGPGAPGKRFKNNAVFVHQGYIDLSYSLNRFGRAGKIRLIGASDNTGKDVRKLLLNQIHSTQFRPVVRNGEAVEQEEFVLRYFYRY